MTGYERAVWWVTERFEGVEPTYRRDVALTTAELTAHAGLYAQLGELVSLGGLALRLRSRRRTGGRSDAVWRQGLYLGSTVVLAMLAVQAWASAAEPAREAGPLGVAVTFAGAVALAASIGCALRVRRSAAVVLAVIGAVASIGAGAGGAEAGVFTGSCVLAVGALLVGAPPPVAAGRWATLVTSALPIVGLPLALAAGAEATAASTAIWFTWVGTAILLALGWFDPRLAAAATTLVCSRLLSTGFDEFAQALSVLAEDGRGALLVRSLLMGTGAVGAWFATNRSIRRLTAL